MRTNLTNGYINILQNALFTLQRNSRKKKSVSLTPTFTRSIASGEYSYSQVNSGSGQMNSLIPFNVGDGNTVSHAIPRNSNIFAGGNHGYAPYATSSGHSTGDIPGLVRSKQGGSGQSTGKIKSKSVHDVSYRYGGSFQDSQLVGQLPMQERSSSDHHHMYSIGDSNLGRLGLPDPDAPVFIPGFFR